MSDKKDTEAMRKAERQERSGGKAGEIIGKTMEGCWRKEGRKGRGGKNSESEKEEERIRGSTEEIARKKKEPER